MHNLIQTDYLMEMSEGDVEFVSTIVDQYKNEVPEILNNLLSACESCQTKVVASLLHKLKSSYLVVGMRELIDNDELLFKEDVTQYDMDLILAETTKVELRFNTSVKELDLFVQKLKA